MIDNALFSSQTDEWETPPALFHKLDAIWHFDLDPCATDENHKCERYFTKEQDGLAQPWYATAKSMFINPPYSQLTKWVGAAHGEAKWYRVITVLLVPARTDTKWFHAYARDASALYLIKGRIKFIGGKHSAPFPSMLMVFGTDNTPEIECMLRVQP